MKNIKPKFSSCSISYWRELFQNSIGISIFSSPAWQNIMEKEAGPGWDLKFLRGSNSRKQIKNIPFLVKKDRLGRFNIIGQPFTYHVTPIETGDIDESLIKEIMKNINGPLTLKFVWALPPWMSWQPAPYIRKTWAGIEKVTARETYVITIENGKSAEEYLTQNVNSTSRRYTRQNFKNELEIITNPASELIKEYYTLYSRTYSERDWSGTKLTLDFFELIASQLNNAGELVIMIYNNKVVGGGVLLYDQHAVHYYQGTIDRDVKKVRPMYALIYRAIQQAVERKLKYVNLGGVNTDNTGLDRFKRSWGAVTIKTSVICWESRFTKSRLFK